MPSVGDGDVAVRSLQIELAGTGADRSGSDSLDADFVVIGTSVEMRPKLVLAETR